MSDLRAKLKIEDGYLVVKVTLFEGGHEITDSDMIKCEDIVIASGMLEDHIRTMDMN